MAGEKRPGDAIRQIDDARQGSRDIGNDPRSKQEADAARTDDFATEGEAVSRRFADSQGGELDSDTQRDADPQGSTLPTRGGRQLPRMPHERDQSAGNQSDGDDPVTNVGAQGHEDLSKGLVDTDRGPPMDELYGKELRPSARGSDGEDRREEGEGRR
ncbi:MAG TPA: hypothetical protein PK177_20230 [Burkholderiaceae bacterium]|nr:hypothetical protein [Burkholderiaceae bacterium]